MEKEEIIEFYVKVLTNYSDALKGLKNDSELSINNITRCDLDKEAIDVDNFITRIKEHGLYSGDGVRIFAFENYKKLMCHALQTYIKELNDSTRLVKDRLGIEDLTFELTDKELKFVERKYQQICKNEE
jgi:hypothetical protein